jgi:hypothetical protein
MRSAILRLEKHILFQNKTSFHEGKIVFKVHYRRISIKILSPIKMPQKTVVIQPQPFSPKTELLKTIVTYRNENLFLITIPIPPDFPNLEQLLQCKMLKLFPNIRQRQTIMRFPPLARKPQIFRRKTMAGQPIRGHQCIWKNRN